MARKIEEIKKHMLETKATLSALDGLTSNSQVSIFGNMFHVAAVEISLLEQLIDAYLENIETLINPQSIGSTPWLRAKILEFQYGDFVELDTTTFEIGYAEVDEALKIITRCSVQEVGNLIVQAKVAKSDPPVALSGAEITALEDYLDVIKPAGTQINVVSLTSDKLYIAGTIYCSGQYYSIAKINVLTALEAYMERLSSAGNFDGKVRVNDIIDAIQDVEGVVDIKLTEVSARAQGIELANRTIIYKLSTGVNDREYETVAGYITQEDTAGFTFTDTLDFESL